MTALYSFLSKWDQQHLRTILGGAGQQYLIPSPINCIFVHNSQNDYNVLNIDWSKFHGNLGIPK
jgi:hypothetical protein